jgi:hypothetical protein
MDGASKLKTEVKLLEQELLEIGPVIQRLKGQLTEIKRKVEGEPATPVYNSEGVRGGQSLIRVASVTTVAACVLFSFHGDTITEAVTKAVGEFFG